jgi:hypothetical protein
MMMNNTDPDEDSFDSFVEQRALGESCFDEFVKERLYEKTSLGTFAQERLQQSQLSAHAVSDAEIVEGKEQGLDKELETIHREEKRHSRSRSVPETELLGHLVSDNGHLVSVENGHLESGNASDGECVSKRESRHCCSRLSVAKREGSGLSTSFLSPSVLPLSLWKETT